MFSREEQTVCRKALGCTSVTEIKKSENTYLKLDANGEIESQQDAALIADDGGTEREVQECLWGKEEMSGNSVSASVAA